LAKKKKKEEKRLRKSAKENPEAVESSETAVDGPPASEGLAEPGMLPQGDEERVAEVDPVT